jgi:hypothetical protein
LYARARYLWEVPEYNDWCDALLLLKHADGSLKRLLERIQENKMDIAGSPFGGIGPRCDPFEKVGARGQRGSGSGVILMMFRWFLLQQLKANGLLDGKKKKYDR